VRARKKRKIILNRYFFDLQLCDEQEEEEGKEGVL